MSDNLKREIDRLGSLNEPSFVFYGNGELAVLLPLVAHKLICLSCLVNNNFNLEKSMYTGNTYYQRHGVLCTSGRKADEVLPLQLMRELIILVRMIVLHYWVAPVHCNGGTGFAGQRRTRQPWFLRKFRNPFLTSAGDCTAPHTTTKVDLRCDVTV